MKSYIINNTSAYQLRQASLKDAVEIWSVMDRADKSLKYKDYFLCDNLNYVQDILTKYGFGVVACESNTNGRIVGNLLVKYPGMDGENLGYDISLEASELRKVVHMDSASVLPDHRGHHLESRMIAYAESLIDKDKYSYAFATVAPGNTASLKSLERNGYRVMVTKEKYGGVLRHVVMKELFSC